MAEIFGAVASGAGLLSLSMQLMDSAQKLKAFYNASKDAPSTVAELSFELETISLSLRQLDSHRDVSIAGDELLGRCFATFSRMVKKINDTVTKIERLIQRCRTAGRIYMAFKEPEIRELLEELERAKSAMSFAYMSYCHSWSLTEATRNAHMLTAQNNALHAQATQLRNLEHTVQSGNVMILDRLTVPVFGDRYGTSKQVPRALEFDRSRSRKRQPFRKYRIALPQCFIDCVWEFGLRRSGNGWELQLNPVNKRPRQSFVFDVVRTGRVPAVRALLQSGSLSPHDEAASSEYGPCESLLDIAASNGHLELCNFLLDNCSHFCEDTMMLQALHRFISWSKCRVTDFHSVRQEADDIYSLFIKRHGLVISLTDEEPHDIYSSENADSNMLLTENSLQQILADQFASNRGLTFDFKFSIAMRSTGWPVDALLGFLRPCSFVQLAASVDCQARTALHWAAKHFGYWASTWLGRDACPDDTMIASYASLMEELMVHGADIHAVNAQHETPLMTMLHQMRTFENWPSCALAVERWGKVLIKTGLTLSEYICVENSLLHSLANKRRIWNGGTDEFLNPDEMQLSIRKGQILAVQIRFCRPVTIWEHWIPPGAWHKEPRLPTRFHDPSRPNGHDHLFWHPVRKVRILSAPYLIQGTSEMDRPFCSSIDIEENRQALYSGAQDDHGPVATMILQDRSRYESGTPVFRSRASSVPPETTQKVYNALPTYWDPSRWVIVWGRSWLPVVHRCPTDLTGSWRPGTYSPDGTWTPKRPRMLRNFASRSFEERMSAIDDWEIQLLRERGDSDIVRKFANRFCPELQDLVEQEIVKENSIEVLG